MKATQTVKGRISGGLKGLGTVTEEMVEARAREIAVINGRPGHEFTQNDFDQARAELTGDDAREDQREEEPGARAATLRDVIPGTTGHKVAPKLPSDDQRFAEQLVREGVEEAEHHSMLAGSSSHTKQNG